MNKDNRKKHIRIKTIIFFIITFLVINSGAHFLILNRKNETVLKATYTSEASVRRIESQINKYRSKSEILKRIIKEGHDLTTDEFQEIAKFLMDEDGVIDCIELAKDGVLSQVYPYENNKQVLGLDILNNEKRKQDAILSKETGEYTLSGPFELIQGGIGALILEPVYCENSDSTKTFWGFTVIVINWEAFIKEIQLQKLEEASYHYRIWKKDRLTGERIIIADCGDDNINDYSETVCDVPNDKWYFDIKPVKGWVLSSDLILATVLCACVAFLITLVLWQFEMHRYEDEIYTEKIKKSAKQAKEANEAKTRFLFNMSHDIRTPMNAIIGFSELLKSHSGEKERVDEYIEKIQASSSLLLSIINQVLEMARIESGTMILSENTNNIREFMKSLETIYENDITKKEIDLEFKIDITHEYVVCDVTKIREIFLNIIGNSVKYTKAGGKISVEIMETSCEKDGYATYKAVIKDTGVGISEEYLPHIFEAFTREKTSTETKIEGTGLGMSIVKAIMDFIGGTITMESKIGEGTKTILEFHFKIADLTDERENNRLPDNNTSEKNTSKEIRILLVEDNELNAEIAITILTENGFYTEWAKNGKECLEILNNNIENYFDVILMDIQMPDMDGYETTKHIRKLKNKWADIPIIAMTANAFEEDRQKAFEAGMNGHMVKPLDINEMINTLKKINDI